MLTAGHLLGNRYRLDERIATGGMGDVWRGTDVVLGRTIAVKVLRSAMLSDPEFAARFYGEARMMAAFRHPGVVEVYDYAGADEDGGEDSVAYLVMAYVEGEPLSTRVKQGPMPVTEVMSIVAQAAEALHAAHLNGTVHRDVKPGNLIVKPNGTVVLVDFGVARSNAVTSVTAVNAIVGTALYMAPEQVAKGNVSPATDIYALGAVAYHCISGHPPFDGDNALQVALRHLEDEPEPLPADVPDDVVHLISRAMAKQPADRFETAAEFAEAAFAAAGPLDWKRLTGTMKVAPLSPAAPTRAVPLPRDLPPTPMPAAATTAARRPPRSQTALLVAVVALLVLAGGLGLAIALSGGGNDDAKKNDNGTNNAPAPVTSLEPTAEPTETTPSAEQTSRQTNRGGSGQSRSASPTPSQAETSTAPTTKPTTTPPTTRPTTTPPATTPATTPPTTPATTPPTTPVTTPPTEQDPGGTGAGTNP
ncbi:serine/threonine-protein kinase [Actinoplanes sp. NPDC048796]|uniref:serine/threonine-protein kinase n=1 Tax=Actinoplanes sp. NPDC048796 TaxID=3155640 RepID=UPI0033CC069B